MTSATDCVQVVIALIVTPEGFPIAYEVLPGNTSDKTTLRDILRKIEAQYGKAKRIWVMDRGIPTEEALADSCGQRSAGELSGGHPKADSRPLESALAEARGHRRDAVRVKLAGAGGRNFMSSPQCARRDQRARDAAAAAARLSNGSQSSKPANVRPSRDALHQAGSREERGRPRRPLGGSST